MTAAWRARWESVAIGALLWALSLRMLASAWRRGVLFGVDSPVLYHAGTNSFGYLEFGAVRRGLASTIVGALGADPLTGTVRFHVLFAGMFAAAAGWLVSRMQRPIVERALAVILVAVLVLRWAEDAGRSDIAVAVLLAAAAWCLLRRRVAAAFACLAIGLAMHETALIFGGPLLIGTALDRGRWRSMGRGSLAAGAAVLGLTLVVYAGLGLLPHADTRTMVETVRAHLPRHVYVDWAIYFAVSGMRGVRTSLCQNANDPNFLVHMACGLALIAAFVELLQRPGGPRRRIAWLVAGPPFMFLDVVANDVSRWAVLAALGVWLLHVTDAIETPRTDRPSAALLRCVLAAVLVPLTHPRVWPIADPVFAPMPVVEHVLTAVGGPPTLRFADALERCDPRWREALGDPPGAR